MINEAYSDFFLPQLRKDIVFGPPERSGGKTVYYMKDKATNWFYRIGAREHFLLSRMDGSRTYQKISEEYEREFGRQLNGRSWAGLLGLIEKRQLLARSNDATELVMLKEGATKKKQAENKGLLRKRFPLINPDAFLESILPLVQFMFQRTFVIPAMIAFTALEVFVLLNLRTIVTDAWTSWRNYIVVILFIGFIWLFVALHEIAHGLTCKKYGGSVREMGIAWRYLTLVPYCKLDDIVLFHNRRHRVYSMFAGTFINLLVLLPFGFLWWLAPEKSTLRYLSALMLLLFNIATLTNFIPFIELDGYFMLSHALHMIDLRKESYRFCIEGLKRNVFRKKVESVGNYTQREKVVYLIYGFFSFIFTTSFLVMIGIGWYLRMIYWLGGATIWVFLLVLFLLILYRGPGKIWAKKVLPSPKKLT